MAITRSFSAMLNEYLDFELLAEETKRRDYIMSKIDMNNNWKGGKLPVPFKGWNASSYAYGSFTATSDVAEDKYVRGEVTSQKVITGTMKFNHRDLIEHGAVDGQNAGQVSEQSFLKNLPDTIDDFVDGQKQCLSVNLLNGSHFATLTSDATANDGTIVVDHPERFQVDQKVIVDDGNSSPVTGYVKRTTGISLDTNTIVLVTTRGGSTAVDFDANNMTVAQNARCYVDGAQSNAFTSLRQQLLSSANGGDATLFGETKTTYPFLQATNYDGSSINSSNILEEIFNGWTEVLKKGRRGKATEVVMSYKDLGNVMKLLEAGSGPYRHVKTEASVFGYTVITVVGVTGQLRLVGVQEMDDDAMIYLDWKSMRFYTNGLFRIVKDPEGKMYFTNRTTSGLEYYVDTECFGECVVYKPSSMGIIHSISY